MKTFVRAHWRWFVVVVFAIAMAWLEAGGIDELPAGRVKLVFHETDDLRIAVCNVDGQFYAIEDVCSHDGGPLDQGQLEGDEGVIESGLAPGERVIVDGVQKVQPGSPVKPVVAK